MALHLDTAVQFTEQYVTHLQELMAGLDKLVIGQYFDMMVEQLAYRITSYEEGQVVRKGRTAELMYADRDGEILDEIELNFYNPSQEGPGFCLYLPQEKDMRGLARLCAELSFFFLRSGWEGEPDRLGKLVKLLRFTEDTARVTFADGQVTWRHFARQPKD